MEKKQFDRYDVCYVNFPQDSSTSVTIFGVHRAVILSGGKYLYSVVPVTSLFDKTNKRKQLLDFDIVLLKEQYQDITVVKDSIIRLSQIKTVDKEFIIGKVGRLKEEDQIGVELNLVEMFGLSGVLNALIDLNWKFERVS
ncbi:hypothetical protein GJ688_06070 [Heliobacillus mobilis]|uniref:Uncharacterized protein n=1 Tax=Heliobacterium mobile TaxID=28064 RepID=A0A6I3SIT5_HELMO|nr:type II toxin-antitoxin system PemK/MazF family toxin [Heliobacterium mobile]MTV48547.1 hypothetical protein [Heliobacterium mobile]